MLDMWSKAEEKHPLPPDLRHIEKMLEEEIMDVLNESWDDSTILRRDNLLAELVLRLDRLIVRFLDDDDSGNKGESANRVLALDMRRVASRMQISPREHRTEISLSVGDMSVQRLQVPCKLMGDISHRKRANELNVKFCLRFYQFCCFESKSKNFSALKR